ncbi:mRNA-degrading endonuclease HigB of HigAB toxin-antitoxin module [Pedobacter africanus]|uniref:mRNA-degrading endonuclease HigB of HigAB toxin-antitoxin module n=1 Tax=Pedobacter africanus TaxID=151894 RepID=A0ACC6KZN8_9SPHI|nr:hypothetical protein [Pedobacter africanus]MDR6784612.1 mRNA-degrading endonuclease HigB of HigAB toxin-antitoxin module [Pedobacter africanus]
MVIISKAIISTFTSTHNDAEVPLGNWYEATKAALSFLLGHTQHTIKLMLPT